MLPISDLSVKIQSFLHASPNGIVVIWWATATGKTGLSLELAKDFPLEIISADSRQVFKYMDIGTDKVTQEQQQTVPHWGIDIVEPDESFTAGQRKQYAQQKIQDIQSREKIPFVVGGTGLYIDMLYRNFDMPEVAPQKQRRKKMMSKESQHPWRLFEQLSQIDPEEAQKHHPNSHRYILRALEIYEFTRKTKTAWSGEQPVEQPMFLLGLRREKEETNRLINQRIREQFTRGLVEEVQRLLNHGYDPDLQSMQGIWYKEIVGYLHGEYDLERAEELLRRNTHHLAKKQRTWFRRYLMDAKVQPKEHVEYETIFL